MTRTEIHATPRAEIPPTFEDCCTVVADKIKKYFENNPEKDQLMELMGVKRFVMVGIGLELDSDVVLTCILPSPITFLTYTLTR